MAIIYLKTVGHQICITEALKSPWSRSGVVLEKPESIMRLSGVIFDALAFCQDDGNFKRERGGKWEVVEG